MDSYFTPDFFRSNRERLRTLFSGTAPIIITSNGLLQRNNDTTFPFRQDSNFWYLTGINEPDITLVMDKGKEYLIVPPRDETRSAFDGSVPTQELIDRSGIAEVMHAQEGWRQLGSRLKRVKHVATLSPPASYVEAHGLYTNPARRKLMLEMKRHNKELEFLDLRPHLTKMRQIKQPLELKAIQQAIDVSVKAFNHVKRGHLSAYDFEYEVEAVITHDFRKANTQHAYQPIIASGQHACTLHYIRNDGRLAQDDILLIDAGAEIEGYAADLTRSYAFKPPTARQQAVHTAVMAVHEYAIGLLKPGVLIKEYEQLIEAFIGEKLRELGLIKVIESKAVRKYYPHSTSHFLGLDVHDVGEYDQPLAAGTVLTVEPGIYIPEEEIGIRIEDDVLITDQGRTVLSDKLARELF
jgi:Xaa-Pro aminopeptidase